MDIPEREGHTGQVRGHNYWGQGIDVLTQHFSSPEVQAVVAYNHKTLFLYFTGACNNAYKPLAFQPNPTMPHNSLAVRTSTLEQYLEAVDEAICGG